MVILTGGDFVPKLIPIDDFIKKNRIKNDQYLRLMADRPDGAVVLACGMLPWEAETAYCWAGPWGGDTIFCRVSDDRHIIGPYGKIGLKSRTDHLAEITHRVRYSVYYYPRRLIETRGRTEDLSGDERDVWLALMSPTEITIHEERAANEIKQFDADCMAYSHKENPYRIYLAGNDDCSYSRVYPNKRIALAVVADLLKNPTMDNLLLHHKFIFTN
jgi:hypothetical protein